ncbi:hypothetical protein DYST_04192 [Dyella terrae]|nr:hypothetical protein DYST_04192 [Dyella terrae]
MIREILKMGDPRLLRVAPLVPDTMIGSAELRRTDRRHVRHHA